MLNRYIMIKYNSRESFYKQPFGATETEQEISLKILVSRRINAMKVSVVFEGETDISFPLSFSSLNGIYEEYTGKIILNREGLYFYRFEIVDTCGNMLKIGKNNMINPYDSSAISPWKHTVYVNTFNASSEYEGMTIYQIFPDRFCKAEPLDTSKHANIKDWGDIPNYIRNPDGTLDTSDFFGGNFKGIESKLDYLNNLGIRIVYLNPIFESSSNHRYDTADYEKTDSLLGSNEDFISLCEKANKFGIKIILDGVFSHTGADSRYFNKFSNYPEIGAYQSTESKYYNWYKFRNWPDDYECWWNVKILPNTDELEPSYLDYITGYDGIARKWLRYGASGWRLDVADELPDFFLEKFRDSVKEEKKDALIIGEVWENAADKISYGSRRKYLHGHQLDSVMNYVFRNAVIDFILYGSADKFEDTVLEICEDYPSPVLNSLMNFLGTHDTERIKTILGSERLVCLAYSLLAFLPGIPTIYYGDETGMEGGKDPLNRLCFPWGNENNDMIEFFAKINHIRLNLKCLINGRFVPLYAENCFFVFSRISDDDECVYAINTSCQPKILPYVFEGNNNLFSGTYYSPGDKINGQDFIILHKN